MQNFWCLFIKSYSRLFTKYPEANQYDFDYDDEEWQFQFICNLFNFRDKGEIDDEILKSLRNDDTETFQSIISNSPENFLKRKIWTTIFDQFKNDKIKYLDYAAAYGSIKCFKYILLNDEEVYENTFRMEIHGGNTEIIRIADNKKIEEVKPMKN